MCLLILQITEFQTMGGYLLSNFTKCFGTIIQDKYSLPQNHLKYSIKECLKRHGDK